MHISVTEAPDAEILALLGRRLARLRKGSGLNQAEVAARAGLDRSTVSRAEQGDNPTLLTVVRLLRVYGRLVGAGHVHRGAGRESDAAGAGGAARG
jgi:transcriptional regulator with XRE-family HTH domain